MMMNLIYSFDLSDSIQPIHSETEKRPQLPQQR